MLDCFTHTGSFALNAAKGGAASVTAVDISAEAVQMAEHNAAINDCSDVMHGLQANVFDLLSDLFNNIRVNMTLLFWTRRRSPNPAAR